MVVGVRKSSADHSTGPMPRRRKMRRRVAGATVAVEMAIGVEDGAGASSEHVKPSSWKWLSMTMRLLTCRPRACQNFQRVADQICPLSGSSAFVP